MDERLPKKRIGNSGRLLSTELAVRPRQVPASSVVCLKISKAVVVAPAQAPADEAFLFGRARVAERQTRGT
jgi:hypothetical protein